MAIMPLPPRRVADATEVTERFQAAATAGLAALWCNHDQQPPPDADWAHSGITRVPYLVLCDSGGFRQTIREHGTTRTIPARRRIAILNSPGAYCWQRYRGPAGMLTASCDTDRLLMGAGRCHRALDLDDPNDFPPMCALELSPPPAEPFPSLVREILACPPGDEARRLALGQALLWQLAHAARTAPSASSPATAIRAWIAERATRPGLGRLAVARTFGISPTHVSRLLAPWGGVAAEVERARLERARSLMLADSTIGLAEVAAACGFVDASHFVRRFRAGYGVTPGAWRVIESRG